MKYDSVQITKMSNGYLVSCIKKGNQLTREPPEQTDFVYNTFDQVIASLNPNGLKIVEK